MLDFPPSKVKPGSYLVKIADLISENPNAFTSKDVSEKLGISPYVAATRLKDLRWANWNVELAATRATIDSSVSTTRTKLRKAETSNEREKLSGKLQMYLKRMEDLTAYRDTMQAGL